MLILYDYSIILVVYIILDRIYMYLLNKYMLSPKNSNILFWTNDSNKSGKYIALWYEKMAKSYGGIVDG